VMSLLPDGKDAKPFSLRDDVGEITLQPLAATVLPAPAASAAPAGIAQLTMQAPVGDPSFGRELGQQVTWLSGQGVKQARIRLHPEELGQLDVKVSLQHDRVDVVFTAQHPGAVNAVQQSLAQLSQMLAQHGLSLGQAEVGQHGQHSQPGHDSHARGEAGGRDDRGDMQVIGAKVASAKMSLLDAFA
ncbi:MAG: flagellar hook-length control protein FliK, partial [Rhodanobacter sp.]